MNRNKKAEDKLIASGKTLTLNDSIAIYCFFLSGIIGLAYEICWIRKASLVFGSAMLALSTVLAVFFGGLALGSYIFGNYSQKVSKPLKIYALLEMGLGVLALLSPIMFIAVDSLFGLFYHSIFRSFPLVSFTRFILVSLILLPPTILMGGTLPLFCRQYVFSKDRISLSVGLLYGVNTLGAAVGCALCGFFLIPNIGINVTIYLCGILNLLIGLVIWNLPIIAPDMKAIEVQKNHSAIKSFSSAPANKRFWTTSVGFLFFLSGFVILGNEIIWSRYLSLIVYNSVYTYTLTITVILLGVVVGSALTAKFFDKTVRRPLIFGSVQIAIGITVMMALMIPADFWSSVIDSTDLTTLIWMVCIVLFLPAVLSGISFPLAIRMVVEEPSKAASGVGMMMAINTVGGIAGSLIVGFFLLPILGLQKSIMIITAISLLIGFISWLFLESSRLPISRYMIIIIISMVWWGIPFVTKTKLPEDFLASQSQLIDFREGISSFVSVMKKGKELQLAVDRAWQGSDRRGHQVMAAHVPMLLHPDPKNILVIGLGAGQTSSRFLMYDIESLECVEIEPEVIQLAKEYFPSDWMKDKRTRFIVEDGRSYITHIKKKFDVISIEVGQVYRPGVAPFYTSYFYHRARLRLKQNGIICQFVPISFFSLKEFQTVVATFLDAFPQSILWYNTQELLLIGNLSDKIKLRKKRFDMLKLNNSLHRDLNFAYWGGISHRLSRPEVFLGGFLVGPEGLAKLSEGATIYRDDVPFLEYSTVRQALSATPSIKLISKNIEPVNSILNFEIDEQSNLLSQSIREKNLGNTLALDLVAKNVSYLKGSRPQDSIDLLRKLVELNPENVNFNFKIAKALEKHGKSYEAILYYNQALKIAPDSTEVNYSLGNMLASQGELQEAIKHYQKAVNAEPNYAKAHYNLGNALAEFNKKEDAIAHYNKALKIEPEFFDAHINIGITLEEQGQFIEAIHHYQKALTLEPKSPLVLEKLAEFYKKRKEYQKAFLFYNKILEVMPENPIVFYNIACVCARQDKPEKSISWLKKAVEKGFDDWNHIKTDIDLKNIRGSFYYKEFIKGH
jgi:spermidine synthase